MPRPTPDGRDWLTSNTIASRLGDAIVSDERIAENVRNHLIQNQTLVEEILQTAFEATGYTTEFKIVRLTEKLKDAILAGQYGDLGTEASPTEVGDVYYNGFKPIYTASVLENYDENGNLIDG